jgi:ubiquinone/menaquinone biosynthesis C-methylase UbiE
MTNKGLPDFEQLYINARRLEERVYDDEAVSEFPDIAREHIHFKEWSMRKGSAERLLKYIEKTFTAPEILEIGCGNGWLSNKLAGIHKSKVSGIDINKTELEQARRVFGANKSLTFLYGPLEDIFPEDRIFDVIVLAAAIQYFENLPTLLNKLQQKLSKQGEIHIIDSPFYNKEDQVSARERTALYYSKLGFKEMSGYYHHHTFESLIPYQPQYLYRGKKIQLLIKKVFFSVYDSPFPWIRIKKML